LKALQTSNARRIQALLLAQRNGIDVSERPQLLALKSAQQLISASCKRWQLSHPNANMQEISVKGLLRDEDFWKTVFEFALDDVDIWLRQMTREESVRLRASVRKYLDDTNYWENRRDHGNNTSYPADGCLDSYVPTELSSDEHMLGWCHVQLLLNDYFVPDMAGELGVVAKIPIPKFTVLGRYAGVNTRVEIFDKKYRGTNQECVRDNNSVSYMVTDPEEPNPIELVIDGLNAGLCTFFNDYRYSIEVGQEHVNNTRMHNINLMHINVCGDPMVLVIAKEKILRGSHMLLDYGDLFWNRFRDDREREKLAMMHYNELVRIATDPTLFV
jgi:hypothetical protein